MVRGGVSETGPARHCGEQEVRAGPRPLPGQVPTDECGGVRLWSGTVGHPDGQRDRLPLPPLHSQPQAPSWVPGCSPLLDDWEGTDRVQVEPDQACSQSVLDFTRNVQVPTDREQVGLQWNIRQDQIHRGQEDIRCGLWIIRLDTWSLRV